jgi:integrase
MPVIALTANLIRTATCPVGKGKIDYFDDRRSGLLFEVRASGGKTWYLRYTDARGLQRQHRIANGSDMSLDQARKAVTELRGQIALGNDPSTQKAVLRAVPTFADFIAERYLPFVKGYKKSWNSDVSYLRNHLLPAFGKKHLDQITKHDVIALHHGMRAKGYALGTANRCLILLRYAMNLAVRWEIAGMTKNPTKEVALFEDPSNKERYLSEEEAQTLYRAVQASVNPMLQYIIPMLILTGARKREVLDAKWTEFDLERRQWRVSITKAGKPRYVPLSDGVVKLLSTLAHDSLTWVFPNPKTGKPYVSIFYSWNTARKQAGLADVRIHDLRHSFASFLVNAGRSLYEVQKILGHTQIKTTQRYAHLSQDTLIDAANVVPFTMDLPMVCLASAAGVSLSNSLQ